jgi:hypothetical protein
MIPLFLIGIFLRMLGIAKKLDKSAGGRPEVAQHHQYDSVHVSSSCFRFLPVYHIFPLLGSRERKNPLSNSESGFLTGQSSRIFRKWRIEASSGDAPRVGYIGEGVFDARERGSNASPMPSSLVTFLYGYKKVTPTVHCTNEATPKSVQPFKKVLKSVDFSTFVVGS